MRRRVLLVLAIVLALLVLVWWTSRDASGSPEPNASAAARSPSPAAPMSEPVTVEEPKPTAAREQVVEPIVAAAAAPSDELPPGITALVGRVVDLASRPIPGIAIELRVGDKYSTRSTDWYAQTVVSDADGKFR